MVLFDNSTFLKHLKKLYDDTRTHGAVYVTFKSVPLEEIEVKHRKGASKEPTIPSEYVCLVRATNGRGQRKREKLSTIVKSKDILGFQLGYGRIVAAAAADGLKKPERKKKKKKLVKVGGATPPVAASKHL